MLAYNWNIGHAGSSDLLYELDSMIRKHVMMTFETISSAINGLLTKHFRFRIEVLSNPSGFCVMFIAFRSIQSTAYEKEKLPKTKSLKYSAAVSLHRNW